MVFSTYRINGITYKREELLGQGASSKVYKIRDEETKQVFALKKVRLSNQDPTVLDGYINEIALLKRLRDHKRIIHLYDSEIVKRDQTMLMVMEYGEADLAQLLNLHQNDVLSINTIRIYWEQILQAVQAIHEQNIIHSDLKPANFLFVQGSLKLIDFGIAKTIPNDTTNIKRDYQTGTANYMAPEAISCAGGNDTREEYYKLGRASDVWSLGCILYQFTYGRPPFGLYKTLVQKMQAIVNPDHRIAYPECKHPILVDIIKCCLKRNPKQRSTIQELLDHEFLNPGVLLLQAFAHQPDLWGRSGT
eukprot:jgi/Hompol1/2768/HPOL_001550-RA